MAVHCVFISSRTKQSAVFDRGLRTVFGDVYRVGVEFWLVDSLHDAEEVAAQLRGIVDGQDKMFVAAMTRDFVPMLSAAARAWLTAPERSWRRGDGCGRERVPGSLFAAAA